MKGQKNWYALKVFYNKVHYFKEIIENDGVETYIAIQEGKLLVPSLMFIKSSEDYLKSLRDNHVKEFTYYKRARYKINQTVNQLNSQSTLVFVPAVIPDDQMEIFKRATAEGVRYLGEIETLNLKPGDRVRVTEGPFKGQVGFLKRIKKDRKFIITIGNIAAFTIEGITYKMVEKINDKE